LHGSLSAKQSRIQHTRIQKGCAGIYLKY